MISSVSYPEQDIGFRFAKYLLGMGLVILPILIYFDLSHGFFIPAVIKGLSTVICIIGLLLARNNRHEKLVRTGAAITLLLVSCIGAIYKLDTISGILWVPVLPALFCFLSNIRHGIILCCIHLVVYSSSYFIFEYFHDTKVVDFEVWLHSELAFLIVFFVSIFFKCEIKKDKAILENEARQDYLTGIANRRGFIPKLESEILRAIRYQYPLSVILMDVDKFKLVNDQYGHGVGDIILQEFSSLLTQEIRTCDVVARWGGEEFIILVPSTGLTSGIELAEKLRSKIEQFDFFEVGKLTASFGIAQFQHNETFEHLIKRSDELLYLAKHTGRNKVVWA